MVWRHFCFLLVSPLGSQRLRDTDRVGGGGLGTEAGSNSGSLEATLAALTTTRIPGWLLGWGQSGLWWEGKVTLTVEPS